MLGLMNFQDSRRPLATLIGAETFALCAAGWAQAVAPGFSSLRLSGSAGGSVRATRYGNTADGFCTGWIGAAPNHTLTLERDFASLTLAVTAPSDTTLVVLGPTGTRCSDDNGTDPNPRISGRFAAGEYRVFVGSYEEGQTVRYTLDVTE